MKTHTSSSWKSFFVSFNTDSLIYLLITRLCMLKLNDYEVYFDLTVSSRSGTCSYCSLDPIQKFELRFKIRGPVTNWSLRSRRHGRIEMSLETKSQALVWKGVGGGETVILCDSFGFQRGDRVSTPRQVRASTRWYSKGNIVSDIIHLYSYHSTI